MNSFQVNHATYKIQTTSYCVEEGESGEDLDGGGGRRGEGVGARRGPDDDQGSGRRGTGVEPTTIEEAVGTASRCRRGPDGDRGDGQRGIEALTDEEQARGMDPTAIREAVGAASRWTRRRSRSAVWTRW
jgi:hypothetical protein